MRAILDADDAYDNAKAAYTVAIGAENAGLADTIDTLKTLVSSLESQKKQADKTVTDADKVIALKDQIEADEKSLKEAQAALSTAKETDKDTQAVAQLDLDAQAKEIEEQKALVEKLYRHGGRERRYREDGRRPDRRQLCGRRKP